MTFLDACLSAYFAALTISLVLALGRALRGPSAADRFVALDLVGLIAAGLFAGHAVAFRDNNSIDIILTFSLILFFGTVAISNLLRYPDRQP